MPNTGYRTLFFFFENTVPNKHVCPFHFFSTTCHFKGGKFGTISEEFPCDLTHVTSLRFFWPIIPSENEKRSVTDRKTDA
jgi:hypothetical protein